jgi:NADPH:quinone reductase-like Zn-dependent oxidoreductase
LLQAGIQTLPYVTAYYSLVTRGRIQAGDSVLVMGALGQVGHAAMSICSWKKCKPLALVRDENSVQKAKALGWDAVASVPKGKSFDLILNAVGAIYWDDLIAALKKFGRMAVIAAPEGKREAQLNLLQFYRDNRELLGINTVDLNFSKSANLLNEMKPGFESNSLTPLTLENDAVFPLEKASLAYKTVLSKGAGKRICLKIDESI